MLKKPKKKKVSLSKLMIKADAVFSKYIRSRDALRTTGSIERVICISCGKEVENHGHFINCGHFIPRYCKSTRYDENNCHGQCVYCNKYLSGNLFCYEEALTDKFGENEVLKLKEAFRDYRCNGFKYDEIYLRNIIEVYSQKLKDLESSDLSINDLNYL